MKKIALIFISIVVAIGCAFGVAACDGGKMTVSLKEFTDPGIDSVSFYYLSEDAAKEIEEENERRKNQAIENGDVDENGDPVYVEVNASSKMRNNTLYGWNFELTDREYSKSKIDNGTYSIIVAVSCWGGYEIQTFDPDSLSVQINGEDVAQLKIKNPGTPGIYGEYLFMITEPISGNSVISFKGNTTIQPYTLQIEFTNKENIDPSLYAGLTFKYSYLNGELIKDNLTAEELKAEVEGQTFTEFLEFTAYFTNGKTTFNDSGIAWSFAGRTCEVSGSQIKWTTVDRRFVLLDFGAFAPGFVPGTGNNLWD